MTDPKEQDQGPDELTERYRRASAADPSRPGEAVRSAIAAQARTEAAARAARGGLAPIEPKARAVKDSHWPLRAAAGLAVVAIGALIAFRITQRAQPGPASAYVIPAPQAEPSPMPAFAAVDRPATGNIAASAERSAAPAAARAEAPAVAPAVASAKAPVPAAALRLAPPADPAAGAGDAAIIRAIVARYFPEVNEGADPGLSRWVLFDHEGRVVRTGRGPAAGEPELRALIEQGQSGARIAQFRTVRIGEDRGSPISIALAWSAAASPAPGP
jgi:hypothetical protein